jgi:hypothetical protein
MDTETATVIIGSRTERQRALERGERMANGLWPTLADAWVAARVIGVGRLAGTEGIACHAGGDYWRFQYLDHKGAQHELRLFRTEVAIMPTRKLSLFPRIHAR